MSSLKKRIGPKYYERRSQKKRKNKLPEDTGAAKIKLEPERFSQQGGEGDGILNRGDTESLKGTTVESLDSVLHVH